MCQVLFYVLYILAHYSNRQRPLFPFYTQQTKAGKKQGARQDTGVRQLDPGVIVSDQLTFQPQGAWLCFPESSTPEILPLMARKGNHPSSSGILPLLVAGS